MKHFIRLLARLARKFGGETARRESETQEPVRVKPFAAFRGK